LSARFLAAGFAVLLAVIPAEADIILDQADFYLGSNQGGPEGFWSAAQPFSGGYPKDVAQTFIVANAGTLTQVIVPVGLNNSTSPGELLFSLVPTVSGIPVENLALALVSIDVAVSPTGNPNQPFTDFIFNNLAVPVTQGESLAIVLQAVGSVPLVTGGANYPYPAGSAFIQQPGSGAFDDSWFYIRGNIGFQTFVDCADPNNCNAFVPPRSHHSIRSLAHRSALASPA
jgi:hypothetical protein